MESKEINTTVDYNAAERFSPWNIGPKLYHRTVTPNWINKGEKFWYLDRFARGKKFKLVDPSTREVKEAFNHEALAAQLTPLLKLETPIPANALPFNAITYSEDLNMIEFQVARQPFEWDILLSECKGVPSKGTEIPGRAYSPDKKCALYVENSNIFLQLQDSSEEKIQLTSDGELHNGYGSSPESNTHTVSVRRLGFPMPPPIIWGNKSKKAIVHKINEQKVSDRYLIQSTPEPNAYKPKLHTYKCPYPGEPELPEIATFILDIENQTCTPVQYKPMFRDFMTPIELKEIWWTEDDSKVYYIYSERYEKTKRLLEVNPETGETREILHESSETSMETNLFFDVPNVRAISPGAEIIWFSERDGYGNLYLYDAASGELKHQITHNQNPVKNIKHVDEVNGWVYYTTYGREGGIDPYLVNLHRSSLDGTKTELLTPEDAQHTITLSPNKKVFLDSYSRVNTGTKTVLRALSGKSLMEFEDSDISYLSELGWIPPEPFSVKARDNETDIFGLLIFPSHFDPTKKYPILDSIYPGPQTIRTPKSFPSAFIEDLGFWDVQVMADLGFIVFMMDGLGTPFRSKKMHDFSYKNLHDLGGVIDHIKALKELAAERPYLDLDRVGIYGHSGGGFASAQAMLRHPEFYKVAVASAGNLDQRGYLATWGEKYSGDPSDGSYDQQCPGPLAVNLRGKLLLAIGEMDDNVPPALTMQLVDALIRANKDFDMLVLPNKTHAFSVNPYFHRKRMDYFVTHLLGKIPPKEYPLREFPFPLFAELNVPVEYQAYFLLNK